MRNTDLALHEKTHGIEMSYLAEVLHVSQLTAADTHMVEDDF